MEHTLLFNFIVLGAILLVTEIECQEYMTLNVPSRAPFAFHPTEELTMDLSEIQPVYLYASSQNDFVHQNLPEHAIVHEQHQLQQHQLQQHPLNPPRPKFADSPSLVAHNQKNNKPRYNHLSSFGNHPKQSTNRHGNSYHNQHKLHTSQYKTQQNGRPNFRPRFQEPLYPPTTRPENQQQNKHYAENMHFQASVHQNRQHANSHSTINFRNGHTNFNQAFNYPTQTYISPEQKIIPQTTDYRTTRNNQGNRNPYIQEEHRKTVIKSHSHRIPQIKEEHRQESVRKHITFENTPQVFNNRNVHSHGNNNKFSPTVSNNYNGHNSQDRNRNNERLNLQSHARSMRGENKPQLPPRPPFENGGVKINTLASELPILQFDPLTTITENPTIFLQTGNPHEHTTVDEHEKKTYILFKAPTLETTEGPTSAPFVVENLQHASPPYVVNNLPQTRVHMPEIYSTPVEPRTLPQNVEAPSLVLDLVQIPDHATYRQPEKAPLESIPTAKFRSEIKEDDYIEKFRPTENYPTTPLRPYGETVHQSTKIYSPLAEDSFKYQSKAIAKPKIKESTRFANYSSLPVTYSSSVSVVSVKQNVDAKQPATKKPKTTLKKSFTHKRKAKSPEYDDFINDYHYESQSVPGEPGVDYPTYKDIPKTNFDCRKLKSPGFYADLEASCQVFHNCDTGKNKHSFMCPNGTIFHQELFICDWWYNVKCDDSLDFYVLNSGSFMADNKNGDSKKKKA